MYVSPAWRGNGGGKKLLARVVSWAAEHGADHLRLSVDSDNQEAQAFYQKAGMSYCNKEMIYQIEDSAFEALRVIS
jgi:ribosomal protein S18 acetylase RimI-like enzyme